MLRLALAAASLAGAAAVHQAELLPLHARGGELYRTLLAAQESERALLADRLGWKAGADAFGYKDTVLDHLNPGTRGTFKQRYFYDTQFCGDKCGDASTPVLAEFTGEWTAGGAPNGAVAELGARIGALLVTVEHRFYGCSRPGGGCTPSVDPTEMTQLLTVEQAVDDAADFIPWFEAFAAGGFTPDAAAAAPISLPLAFKPARKWGIAGGSYAGAYVTWVTVRHGDLLSATWSSSGVVNAIYNFTGFDHVVSTAVGDDCSNALRAVMTAFEAAWNSPVDRPRMLALFNAPVGWHTAGDFAWLLADSAGMAPQYGSKQVMCNFLNSTARDTPSSPAPPNPGRFPTGFTALTQFAAWTNSHYGKGFGSSCYYSTSCLASNDAAQKSDTTTWVWQCCSQLAYWNAAQDIPGTSVRSSWVNASYFEAQCHAAFDAYEPTAFPDTVAFNSRWGGDHPFVGSHPVFATQGSDDPWQGAGVCTSISDTYIAKVAECAGCSHCRDLQGSHADDPKPLTETRDEVMALMEAWMSV